MNGRRRLWDLLCGVPVLAVLAGLLWLPSTTPGQPGPGTVANVFHVALAGLAAWAAARSARLLGAGNRARPAWSLLAAGCGAFLLGELVDAYHEVWRLRQRPFPSWEDAIFLAGYACLALALLAFARLYLEARSEMGASAAVGAWVGGGALACAALGAWLLPKLATLAGSPVARALSVTYPLLDLALVVLALALLRLTLAFRGGSVWRVWASLLCGIAFMCIADLAFAVQNAGGHSARSDDLMEALYVVAYALIARGALVQVELVGD